MCLTSVAHASVFSEKNEQGIPLCDDYYLMMNVSDGIKEYQKNNPPYNIIELRKQKLVLKNLNNFSEVPVTGFSQHDDFEVARDLVALKINNSLSDDNIRLCKNSAENQEIPIYLMIYYLNYEIFIKILNFAPAHEEFVIKYQQLG
jgi:hypothetical protein